MSKETKKKGINYGKTYLFLCMLFLAGIVLALIGRLCGARPVEFERRTGEVTGKSVAELTEDELGSVKNLAIDVGITGLTVERGERFEIVQKEIGRGFHIGKYTLFEASELRYEIDGNTLYIKDNSPEGLSTEGVFGFLGNSTITVPFIGELSSASKYEITLPENLSLDDVEIDSGACSISVDELQAKNIDIDIGAGEIRFEKLNCDGLSADIGMGEVRIDELYVRDSAVIELNMGEVRIEDGECRNVETEVNMGELRMGGKLEGENSFNCDMGEIYLNLAHPREYYAVTAEKAMGEIYIDGSEKGDYDSEPQNYRAEIEADVSMGEIHMEFQ